MATTTPLQNPRLQWLALLATQSISQHVWCIQEWCAPKNSDFFPVEKSAKLRDGWDTHGTTGAAVARPTPRAAQRRCRLVDQLIEARNKAGASGGGGPLVPSLDFPLQVIDKRSGDDHPMVGQY